MRNDVNKDLKKEPLEFLSFSQCGEDRVLWLIFSKLGCLLSVNYIDIGSAHPVFHNNTYLFYKYGCRGVLVEADPKYVEMYDKERQGDAVVSAACVPYAMRTNDVVEFFVSDDAGWSSVSMEHVALGESLGKGGVASQFKTRAITINEVMQFSYEQRGPCDLLTLDIEGVDRAVLEELEFDRYAPKVIVVEHNGEMTFFTDYLGSKNYSIFSFNAINAVFVRNDIKELVVL